MWVTRTLCLPALVELANTILKPFLFAREIPGIADNEFLVGRAVLGERFLIGVDRLHKRTNDPADQDARRIQLSRRHVENAGTMCHHLRHIHFSGRRLSILPITSSMASFSNRFFMASSQALCLESIAGVYNRSVLPWGPFLPIAREHAQWFITAGVAWVGALSWTFIIGPIEEVKWDRPARRNVTITPLPVPESAHP
jgi:hypothetical protein